MLKSFWWNKQWAVWAWGGLVALIGSLWLQVQMTVAINTWYGGFYDLLQNAGDYIDKPQEGIDQLYQNLISLKYTLFDYLPHSVPITKITQHPLTYIHKMSM